MRILFLLLLLGCVALAGNPGNGTYGPAVNPIGNGSGLTNVNVSTLAPGNTSTSNNWFGTFAGNGGGLTNLATGVTIGSNAPLGNIGPFSVNVTGGILSSKPGFVDNSAFCPWIPWGKVSQKAATNRAVVGILGDSTAANNLVYSSCWRHFMQNLWGLYGCAGMMLQPTAKNGNPNLFLPLWPYTNYWWGAGGYNDASANDGLLGQWAYWAPNGVGNVTSGGTAQFGQGADIPVNQATLYYVASPYGGTITFVADTVQGNYFTNCVNGFAASPVVKSVTMALPMANYYGFFATNNTSGTTNVILGCAYINTNMNGIVYCDMGGNGISPHLTLAQMNAVPTNLLTQFFAMLNLDICVYSKLDYGDPGAQTPTQMYTNIANIVNCFPTGTPFEFALNWMNPNLGTNELGGGMTTNNAVLTAFAVTNGDYLIDLASQFPNYSANLAAGLVGVGDINAHPTWYGACVEAAAAAELCHIPVTPWINIMDTGPGSIQTFPLEIVPQPGNGGSALLPNGWVLRITNMPTATGSSLMYWGSAN